SRICPPLRPPLFPYTTLFRSSTVAQATPRPVAGASQELDHDCLDAPADVGVREVGPRFGNVVECLGDRDAGVVTVDHAWINIRRSEEHTSELQSRFDLVCRLL